MASQPVTIIGGLTQGMTTGEHHGHQIPHSPCTLSGTITTGTSKLRSKGVFVSLAGASIDETDCCGPGAGNLGAVAHKLRVNGISVQIVGDITLPHNGTSNVISGSQKIKSV